MPTSGRLLAHGAFGLTDGFASPWRALVACGQWPQEHRQPALLIFPTEVTPCFIDDAAPLKRGTIDGKQLQLVCLEVILPVCRQHGNRGRRLPAIGLCGLMDRPHLSAARTGAADGEAHHQCQQRADEQREADGELLFFGQGVWRRQGEFLVRTLYWRDNKWLVGTASGRIFQVRNIGRLKNNLNGDGIRGTQDIKGHIGGHVVDDLLLKIV